MFRGNFREVSDVSGRYLSNQRSFREVINDNDNDKCCA